MPARRSRSARRWLAVAGALFLSGCASIDLADFRTVEVRADAGMPVAAVSTYAELPLHSGQVVVSDSGSSLSFLMDLMASEYSPYGHAGILSVEGDDIFVYEAFGFLNARIWQPPTRRLRGKVRRVSLASFLARASVAAIYEHDFLALDAVASFARTAYEDGVPFDGLFDYRTPDRVYCNEFVALALQRAGHDDVSLVARTTNESLNQVMGWLGLDTPAFLKPAALLDGAHEVARFSKRYSAAQIEAHFAFERDLHARFTREQKLGNVFRWTYAGPRYRPHIAELRAQLLETADAASEQGLSVEQQIESVLNSPPVLASELSATDVPQQPLE